MENESAKKQRRFLIVWTILNLSGWIIGFIFVLAIQYNLYLLKEFVLAHGWVANSRQAWSMWPGEVAFVWLPLGLCIGISQWVKLRNFGVKLFIWVFVTTIGFSTLAQLCSWALNLDLTNFLNSWIISIAFFFKIYRVSISLTSDVVSFWVSSMGFFSTGANLENQYQMGMPSFLVVAPIGTAIIGALQSFIIRRHIPIRKSWIEAYILGLLALAPVVLLAFLTKSFFLKFFYFFHLWDLVNMRWELFFCFLIIVISISVSMFTGNILLEQLSPDSVTYLEGERLAVKGAAIGGIAFGFISLTQNYFDTRRAVRIGLPLAIEVAVFVALIAITFTRAPARFMGGRLANSLEIDAHNHKLSERSAILKGVCFGVIVGCATCLPLWAFLLRGDIIPGLLLSGEAMIIAAIAGGWTGKQLKRFIIQ